MSLTTVTVAHEQACKAGYIHRDISAGNILLHKSSEGSRWEGLLNDWELAAKYDFDQSAEVNAANGEYPNLERTVSVEAGLY